MLKKLLIGLFLLGMLCGAGFSSAGSSSARVIVPTGDSPSLVTSKIMCGGTC